MLSSSSSGLLLCAAQGRHGDTEGRDRLSSPSLLTYGFKHTLILFLTSPSLGDCGAGGCTWGLGHANVKRTLHY